MHGNEQEHVDEHEHGDRGRARTKHMWTLALFLSRKFLIIGGLCSVLEMNLSEGAVARVVNDFAGVDLGDRRLQRRAQAVVMKLATCPSFVIRVRVNRRGKSTANAGVKDWSTIEES